MNGLLIIDKEKDYTSRDIVNIVGKQLTTRKVGHIGTLDPMATGVLILAIGEGLKIISFLENDTKEYVAEVKCGITTDTFDVSGEVLKEDSNYILNKDKILEVLNSFLGRSMQTVPIYSAVRVNGKRLYHYARSNEKVDLPSKEIEILDIELLSLKEDGFSFRVVVSKGTYIRSLIRDIGEKLNILCTMSNLRRIKVGIFDIKDSNTLDDIKRGDYKQISIEEALSNYYTVNADEYLEERISHGSLLENRYDKDLVVFKNNLNKIIAIYVPYSKDNTKIKPIKIFNV